MLVRCWLYFSSKICDAYRYLLNCRFPPVGPLTLVLR